MDTSSKARPPRPAGKGRKTRAGNDLDSFPFDKLSVDGAALAKMIISPLPDPTFSMQRARDPLDNRDSTATSTSSTVNTSEDGSPKSQGKKKFDPDAVYEEVNLSPETSQKHKAPTPPSSNKFFDANRSPDPEAKHVNRIFRKGSSDVGSFKANSDSDSYYEVYDSPGVSKMTAAKSPGHEYYSSDVISESGWESGMSLSLTDEASTDKVVMSPRMSRIAADGKVHRSPSGKKKKLNQYLAQHSLANNEMSGNPDFHPDPDGDLVEELSTHGESLVPTPDGDVSYGSGEIHQYSSNVIDAQSDSSSSIEEYVSDSDEENIPSSSEKVEPRVSAFPSNRLLVFLVIMIALVSIGLIAALTMFLLERTSMAPECPPDDPSCNDPPFSLPVELDADGNPVTPSDGELMNLFVSVVGEAAKSDFTSAGMAAKWMIDEDPGKLLRPRSDEAWIQRYLLVYTYYATTLNRETSWLSCNPFTEDENAPELDDEDACMYTYPTELPGGRVIYDLVPSHRWLSAADECQWGGVACGKTVEDEIMIGNSDPNSIPIKSTMKRLAVTSIVLADQYLKGSVVTELTALPELQVLDLSHNSLQGTLSEDFRSLETLRLQYNAIQGSIPNNFFDDESAMKELNVGSNLMTGTIPDKIGLTSTVTDLYLFKNRFDGSIPNLGNMPLENFHGQQNSFTGIMPFDYGYWPETLREWWVSDNKLSGALSEHLGFLSNLEDLRVDNNELTGVIPESIKDLQRLYRFDVQYNSLTGSVPEVIAELPQLRDVRLQFNDLTGVVPTDLCFLESMELLEADCLAASGEPQIDCYCCTSCCNPAFGNCQVY